MPPNTNPVKQLAGYSATPLIKKLGIKPGMKLLLINPPQEYMTWLEKIFQVSYVVKKNSRTLYISLQKTVKSFDRPLKKYSNK